MPRYVDGFVLAVPKNKLSAYKKMAANSGKVWIKHGALEFVECVAEKLNTGFGMPFTKAVKAKAGETVMFSWIVYKSRAHRDKVVAKVMSDPMMDMDLASMPFDMKRMANGVFKVLVEA